MDENQATSRTQEEAITPIEAQAKAHSIVMVINFNNVNGVDRAIALITAALTGAYAQGRRAGLEEAAKLCHEMAIKEGFANITKTDHEEESRKSCAWMMDQCAVAIRAQAAQEGKHA